MDEVMGVFHSQAGENAMPFYHPKFPDFVFEEIVDPEMNELAKLVFNSEKKKAATEKKPNYKEIIKKATQAGFRTTEDMYCDINDTVEKNIILKRKNKRKDQHFKQVQRQNEEEHSSESNQEGQTSHKRKAKDDKDVEQPETKEQKRNNENNSSGSVHDNNEEGVEEESAN
jgi:hypothetical protein